MMKQITLDIIKKNRVYFKCVNEQGYAVKLKVTSKSEGLALGKQELLVKDCSIRTKYGTDVVYEMEEEIKEKGIVTLAHKYNENLVEACSNLGGKWDEDARIWVFSEVVEDKVDELDEKYNSNIVTIEIEALEDNYTGKSSLKFLGYSLARAYGRDSGATVCDGVSMIEGRVYSCGSVKNWATECAKGTKFRLEISLNLLNGVNSEEWKVRII